jgi:hypothetical protein
MVLALHTVDQVLTISGSYGDRVCDIEIRDEAVLQSLDGYEDLGAAINSLLTVGAHALQAAGATSELVSVRTEIDRAVDRASQAMGVLEDRLLGTLEDGGVVDEAFARAQSKVSTAMQELLAAQANGDNPTSLIGKVAAASQEVTDVLDETRRDWVDQMARMSERQSAAIATAVAEMRDLPPGSAIASAFDRIERSVSDLVSVVERQQGAAGERARGTAKGARFEDDVAEVFARMALPAGDVVERTGKQAGMTTAGTRLALRGDITISVGDAGRMVVEVANRDSSKLTHQAVTQELSAAMENRGAQFGICVVSSPAPILAGGPLAMLGGNHMVVMYDPEHPDEVPLQLAYRLGRWATLRAARNDTLDTARLRDAVEQIGNSLRLLTDARRQMSTSVQCQRKAAELVAQYERTARAMIASILNSLGDFEELRAGYDLASGHSEAASPISVIPVY